MTWHLDYKTLPLVFSILLQLAVIRSIWGNESQSIGAAPELELTESLVRSIEPLLSNPATNSKLEIYDRLVYGKGRMLRIDGKSRRNVVLALDAQAKYLVRLFDVPGLDARTTTLKGIKYFTGVCSRSEITAQGAIEISISYATVGESPGRNYSSEAEEFVARTHEMKKKNEQLSGRSSGSISSESQSINVVREPKGKADRSTSAEAKRAVEDSESGANEESAASVGNRPALKRRVGGEVEKSSRPQPDSRSSGPAATAHPGNETDVVIYRRKGTASKAAKSENSGDTVFQAGTEVETASTSATPKARSLPGEVDGMMLISEGYVTLGSDLPDDNEQPLHRVFVKAFYIDKYEVTNLDYQSFCSATGHRPPPHWKGNRCPAGLEKHPVVQVGWSDAVAFCQWAGKRLPTEVEWERAAKGPNSYRYAYGNLYDLQKANTEHGSTKTVGSYRANEFGLYDMTGNVNEWTSSLFVPYPYKEGDGRENLESPGSRVLRGGSFASNSKKARCLVRLEGSRSRATLEDGFRCARDGQ